MRTPTDPVIATRDIDVLTDDLCDALLTAKSRDEMRRLLVDLCTPAEIRTMAERWHVARLLDRASCLPRNSRARPGSAPPRSFASAVSCARSLTRATGWRSTSSGAAMTLD